MATRVRSIRDRSTHTSSSDLLRGIGQGVRSVPQLGKEQQGEKEERDDKREGGTGQQLSFEPGSFPPSLELPSPHTSTRLSRHGNETENRWTHSSRVKLSPSGARERKGERNGGEGEEGDDFVEEHVSEATDGRRSRKQERWMGVWGDSRVQGGGERRREREGKKEGNGVSTAARKRERERHDLTRLDDDRMR